MKREKKTRILFINRSYWPDTEATGQLLASLCEGLANDFEIEVISGRPNHSQEHFSASTVGAVRRRGITIQRVLHTRFAKSSWVGRLVNLVTFTFSAFLATMWRVPRPDIVVTETDPFFLPIIGRFVKWRYNIPYVAYLQDIYPDIAIALGKAREGTLIRLLRRVLVSCCNHADRVVVLSEDMRQRCIRNGVRESLVEIIPNWADCKQVRPVKNENQFRKEHRLQGKFVVMYSGNLGMAHLLEPIIDAATKLRELPEIVFFLIGEGVQRTRLERIAEERGLHQVRFLPYQPRDYLDQSLSAADVQIVSMLPQAKGCLMPSKIYGILASGTAVLSLSPTDCDVSRFVTTEEVGANCDPLPAETLVDRLSEIIRNMADNSSLIRQQGLRGRELCVKEFDRPLQVKRFRSLFNSLRSETQITPSRTVEDHENPSLLLATKSGLESTRAPVSSGVL